MNTLLIGGRGLFVNGGRLSVIDSAPEPPLPPLPSYTIRLKFTEGVTPTFSKGTSVQVSSSPNIWDLTYENTDWYGLVENQTDLLEVIDGNTSSVTSMASLFNSCSNLTSVALFDTSSVTEMGGMFYHCSGLTSIPLFDMSNVTSIMHLCVNCISLTFIPLFDTSSVVECDWAFSDCINVQTGALALYNQLSSQGTVMYHDGTFRNCGSNTTTGAAELAQISGDWK